MKSIILILFLTAVSAFSQSDNIQIVRIRRDIALLQAQLSTLTNVGFQLSRVIDVKTNSVFVGSLATVVQVQTNSAFVGNL